MVKEGVCFYLEHSNTAQEQRPHVYMVIAESGPEVVIVHFTTFSEQCSDECIVGPGEHPSVPHKSVINFKDAKPISRSVLERRLASGESPTVEPLTPDLLRRIQRAARTSREIPRRCARILPYGP